MSRDDGFPIADVDVGLMDDPKVRSLVRSTRDEALVARCMVAYVSIVLASWRQGDRVTLDDAAPLWLTDLADLGERLAEAGLLDPDGRLPEKSWTGWFGPAHDRREERREAGRLGGLAKARNRDTSSRATAELQQSSTRPSVPTVPTVPTVPSVPSKPDRNAREAAPKAPRATNGAVPTDGPCRVCGADVRDTDPGVHVGPGWIAHSEHPAEWVA